MSATGSLVGFGEVVGCCGVVAITEGNIMHSLLKWLRSIVVVQKLAVVSALLRRLSGGTKWGLTDLRKSMKATFA